MTYGDILKMAQQYEDAATRKEINNIMKAIKSQLPRLAGNDLVLLKNYLKKIVEY